MKRVQSGCILQTLTFSQKADLGFSKEHAARVNHEEFEHYKTMLERAKTRYQIVDMTEQEDGSLTVRVRKQLNDRTDVSEYFR